MAANAINHAGWLFAKFQQQSAMHNAQSLNRRVVMPSAGVEPLGVKLTRVQDGGSADMAALNAMMLASPSHLLLTQRRLPSINEGTKLFSALPPGTRREDKFLWCGWQDRRVVACIEIIRHWPARDVAYVGLLLVDEAQRRRGIGTETLDAARQVARGWSSVRRLQLAVAENNAGAIAFWRHAGFRSTGVREQRPDFTAALMVMERPLG
jgi:ribosomal protein S18 acetylase RimI-like enzyme